jgi:hypothetical protein
VGELRDEIKQEILHTFNKKVKGRVPDLSGYNKNHDGAEGDWLTIAMGLTVNGKNEPDFKGFEMKKDSKKTTFGDWQPDYSLYKKPSKGLDAELSRTDFLKIFGQKSKDQSGRKLGRYSWSGKVFPTVKGVNTFGQVIKIDSKGHVKVLYSFSKDSRSNKKKIVPVDLRIENLVLAEWTAENLKKRLEKKFNNLGWFKCLTDSDGRYEKVQFGKPINFDSFITMARSGEVFCDCGMYSTNPRPYMTWRAAKNIWDSLAE